MAETPGSSAYALDDWGRLDRFLLLGSCRGAFRVAAQALAPDDADAVRRCLAADGPRAVDRIVEVARSGRAAKPAALVYALALAAGEGDAPTRTGALRALPTVCRDSAGLFRFAEYVDGMRGWGRGLRRAVADWYLARPLDDLVSELIASRGAGKEARWSHRDLVRVAHPKARPDDAARAALFEHIVRPKGAAPLPSALARLAAAERLREVKDAASAARLVAEHKLPRAAVPAALSDAAIVWAALLPDMATAEMLEAMAAMAPLGLLRAPGAAVGVITERLGDARRIKRARLHPLAVLAALEACRAQADPSLVAALERAFLAAFATVAPTGKRLLLAIDVADSMRGGAIAGSRSSPRAVAAVLAMIAARVEDAAALRAFGDTLAPLPITRRSALTDVLAAMDVVRAGRVDCALPLQAALAERRSVDAFVVLTDAPTDDGALHPRRALADYRAKMGIAARLVVVGMTSAGFAIADPDDAGMLDVIGLDAAAAGVIGEFAAGRI